MHGGLDIGGTSIILGSNQARLHWLLWGSYSGQQPRRAYVPLHRLHGLGLLLGYWWVSVVTKLHEGATTLGCRD